MHILDFDGEGDGLWQPVSRPGYLGRRRNEVHAEWNATYGVGNWALAWKVDRIFIAYRLACRLYEDAYHAFLSQHPDVTDQLVVTAKNVYDDAVSNVASGFDYMKQETDRTHIQDIAIRNALLRMGRWFEGERLIQIRDAMGDQPLSLILSPGRVPFHQPQWIDDQLPPKWWKSDSVESFYQSNRWLMVRDPS